MILPDHECRDEKFHFIIPTFSPKEDTRLPEIEIENDLLQATSHLSREIDLKCPCFIRCRGSVKLSGVFLARFLNSKS